MPSKADALETAFGDELRALARIHTTARRLKGALEERRPPLQYSDGVLKQWLVKYGPASGKATLSVSDLQEQYGEVLHAEARNAPTAYKLQKALGRRQPPIEASEATLKIWLTKYYVPESYTKVITASRHAQNYKVLVLGGFHIQSCDTRAKLDVAALPEPVLHIGLNWSMARSFVVVPTFSLWSPRSGLSVYNLNCDPISLFGDPGPRKSDFSRKLCRTCLPNRLYNPEQLNPGILLVFT